MELRAQPAVLLLISLVVMCYVFFSATYLAGTSYVYSLGQPKGSLIDLAVNYSGSGTPVPWNVTIVEVTDSRKTSTVPASNPAGTTLPNSKLKTTGSPAPTISTVGMFYKGGFKINDDSSCPEQGANLKMLIFIMSAPNHENHRLAIRQTWGHYGMRKDMVIRFLLGLTDQKEQQKRIETENGLFGDIIQGNFVDSYRNLTLKTLSMLDWIDVHCYKAMFVLKCDDDMFINIPELVRFISAHTGDSRTIYGRLAKKWSPVRNTKSKYYISKASYTGAHFPDFTTGPAYLLTGDVVHDLFMAALNENFIHLEDVFTTGIVAQKLKIKRVSARGFLNVRVGLDPCKLQHAISVHMVKFDEQFEIWKSLSNGKPKCTSKKKAKS